MVCGTSTLAIETLGDFLVWPTYCSYYFYLYILFTIMIIISWTLYKVEELKVQRANFLSNIAISSIVTTFLAVTGTFVENSDGIPMIQSDILLYILAVCIPIVLIWIFKKD